MKKIILFLFIVFTLLYCTSTDKSEVIFFNNITFELIDGEEIISIDSREKENYHSYFNNTSIQVPLFRCIKSDNYVIYLGIPINTSIKKFADFKLEHTNNSLFFESDTNSYFYISHQNDHNYISEYSRVVDDNMIYVLTVSNSLELHDSLFNMQTLSKRLNR